MITQEKLKERFIYNADTGIFTWRHGFRVKEGNEVQPNSFDKDGYKLIGITVSGKRKTFRAHKLAWLYVYGEYPNFDLDHRDRIKTHNWISNLRKLDNQYNQRNTGNWRTNTSGVKGICWRKNCNLYRWYVAIRDKTTHKNQRFLGWFTDFDEAVCTRLAAEQCLNWERYDSSSPAFDYVERLIGRRLRTSKWRRTWRRNYKPSQEM